MQRSGVLSNSTNVFNTVSNGSGSYRAPVQSDNIHLQTFTLTYDSATIAFGNTLTGQGNIIFQLNSTFNGGVSGIARIAVIDCIILSGTLICDGTTGGGGNDLITFTQSSGTCSVNSGVTITLQNSAQTDTAGNVLFAAGSIFNFLSGANADASSGTWTIAGTLNGDGSDSCAIGTFNSGTMNITGSVSNIVLRTQSGATATININTGASVSINGINNQGTFNVTGGTTVTSQNIDNTGGVFSMSGGSLTYANGAQLIQPDGTILYSIQSSGLVSDQAPEYSLLIIQGDAYLAADGRAFLFTKSINSVWPADITTWSVSFEYAQDADGVAPVTIAGTVITATGSGQQVQIQFTAAQTSAMLLTGSYTWSVVLRNGSDVVTVARGILTVLENP